MRAVFGLTPTEVEAMQYLDWCEYRRIADIECARRGWAVDG